MNFNHMRFGDRLRLAQALESYFHLDKNPRTGEPHSGPKSQKKCAEDFFEPAGISISQSSVSSLLNPPRPEQKEDRYPKAPKCLAVAQFLSERGFYPPAPNLGDALKGIAIAFGSYGARSEEFLSQIANTYETFQRSNRQPGDVIKGTCEIGKPNDLSQSDTSERISHLKDGFDLHFKGVAIGNPRNTSGGVVYLILHEAELKYPRFLVLDRFLLPDGAGGFRFIGGFVLGGARDKSRHLSPICLYRESHAMQDHELPLSQVREQKLLPDLIVEHLSLREPYGGGS